MGEYTELLSAARTLVESGELERRLEEELTSALEGLAAEEEERPEPGVYWPSMVGQCLRRSWFLYSLGPRPPAGRSLRIMLVGRVLHELVARAMSASGRGVESEVEVELEVPPIRVRGRADNVLLLRGARPVVVEVKTVSERAWSRASRAPRLPHVLQLALYMRALGASEGYLVYVCRNDLSVRAYRVLDGDGSLFEMAVKRLLELHMYVARGRPPPPEAAMDADMVWQCRTCPYREECEGLSRGQLPVSAGASGSGGSSATSAGSSGGE